jgi:hypothetical protein
MVSAFFTSKTPNIPSQNRAIFEDIHNNQFGEKMENGWRNPIV